MSQNSSSGDVPSLFVKSTLGLLGLAVLAPLLARLLGVEGMAVLLAVTLVVGLVLRNGRVCAAALWATTAGALALGAVWVSHGTMDGLEGGHYRAGRFSALLTGSEAVSSFREQVGRLPQDEAEIRAHALRMNDDPLDPRWSYWRTPEGWSQAYLGLPGPTSNTEIAREADGPPPGLLTPVSLHTLLHGSLGSGVVHLNVILAALLAGAIAWTRWGSWKATSRDLLGGLLGAVLLAVVLSAKYFEITRSGH